MQIQSKEIRDYRSMELVPSEDFKRFIADKNAVAIEEHEIKIGNKWDIKEYAPAKDYSLENDTVWSFQDRGKWATHVGNYRGNWSPYIPRNLILKYTSPCETVLDQMMGSGTTLVECKLLGRNAIGVDVNRDAVMVALDRLNFRYNPLDSSYPEDLKIQTYVGDARHLDKIDDDSIDLVATHPPYAGIIRYTSKRVEGDLSALKLRDYLREMRVVAQESLRVLRPDKHCAILMGDTRKHLHYIPISARVLEVFLDAGFILREDIIKLQWKTRTTRERWRGKSYSFYKIAHEHLYIFRKPSQNEKLSPLKHSRAWHREDFSN